jgi:hypothetical protein
MTKLESEYIIRWANKIRGIQLLGGKCSRCEIDNVFCLEFHHINNKNFNISDYLNRRWSILENEIHKCILLCANCHNEEYDSTEYKRVDRVNRKKICLDYLDSLSCERCEYRGKHFTSLEFHHLEDKNFGITFAITRPNIYTVKMLYEELDKCIVLCSNCHSIEHVDKDMFNKFKDKIYKKIKNYKEKSPKVDRQIVKSMLTSGIKQVEIAKQLGVSKSTISLICKNF